MQQRTALRFATLGLLAVLASTRDVSAAGCPTAVHFLPNGTGATLDAGWSGFAHDQPVFGTTLHLGVSCAASTPPCGTCAITGAVADPTGHRLRCRNDTSIACTVATAVADCGASDTCRYYLGPPQSLATGGAAFCATTEVNGTIGGTVDVENGSFAPTVPVRATVYRGVVFIPSGGGPSEGCPRCDGDTVPNDSVRGGICDAGARAGLPCDANGATPFSDFGSTSFDCPPDSAADLGEFSTGPLPFSTTPDSVTLTGASPNCSAGVWHTSLCLCSTCNDAAAEPCASNADCPPSGGNPGICGGKRCRGGSNGGTPCNQNSECPGATCDRPGMPTQPNACSEDTVNPNNCSPDGDGGICAAGPVDLYCTNHRNRGCLDASDCDDVPGSCGVVVFRPCFLDNGVLGGSVSVDGTATPPVAGVSVPTDLGALACLRPTGNAFVDIWGLPGLARLHQPGVLLFDDATVPPPTPCPATPTACRAPTVAHKSSLQLTDRSPDNKDRLGWKWLRGAATTVPELGDPLASDDYALCLYDASGLRATMNIPAGGTCGTRPCWQQKSPGFRYRNTGGMPNGVTELVLRAGTDGRAQMQAKGKGLPLPMPPLMSLTTTLQVQLRNRTSGLCWSASYSPPFDRATTEQLRDRAD